MGRVKGVSWPRVPLYSRAMSDDARDPSEPPLGARTMQVDAFTDALEFVEPGAQTQSGHYGDDQAAENDASDGRRSSVPPPLPRAGSPRSPMGAGAPADNSPSAQSRWIRVSLIAAVALVAVVLGLWVGNLVMGGSEPAEGVDAASEPSADPDRNSRPSSGASSIQLGEIRVTPSSMDP